MINVQERHGKRDENVSQLNYITGNNQICILVSLLKVTHLSTGFKSLWKKLIKALAKQFCPVTHLTKPD